ncbi:hypothetical protein ATI61_105448 [Archangium gephyra]|uniref:Uncharacterized protein n=1 Tax=Archangium gephyra TaxID=48 RepID=A0AAC8THW9_9BACT|nr:hypothetical protein [Archangium gephyra]AKJ06568.1 Hypothetical protein AA314_08194 [Archangium gephyra]REG32120.1 hypothetical protein ATI61_105448 [Archangium gephyra]
MQPKKRPSPKTGAAPTLLDKGQAPRRPVGVQALGPARYEQLRQVLHQLALGSNRTAAAR